MRGYSLARDNYMHSKPFHQNARSTSFVLVGSTVAITPTTATTTGDSVDELLLLSSPAVGKCATL